MPLAKTAQKQPEKNFVLIASPGTQQQNSEVANINVALTYQISILQFCPSFQKPHLLLALRMRPRDGTKQMIDSPFEESFVEGLGSK